MLACLVCVGICLGWLLLALVTKKKGVPLRLPVTFWYFVGAAFLGAMAVVIIFFLLPSRMPME